jgi:signal transduction histidine kinase/sugar phosphate isomerase/epimerase
MATDPAQPRRSLFHIAFGTIVWGQRIDDLDYMLKVLRACGYEGVEIAQSPENIFVLDDGLENPRPIGDIDHLVERCESYGLTLIGLVGGTLDQRVKYLGKRRDIYLYLDHWPDDAWRYLVQSDPIRLAIHPHWLMRISKRKHFEELIGKVGEQVARHYESLRNGEGAGLHTKAECAELTAKAMQHLGLIVDTAHAVIAEDNPREFVWDHLDRLEAVHIKDWRPDFGRWSHRYPKGFCIPGEGIVPVDDTLNTLAAKHYCGWIVLEQDFFEYSREDTARRLAEWLASHRRKWPFRISVSPPEVVNQLATQRHQNPFRLATGTLGALEMARAFAASPNSSTTSFYRNVVTTLRTLLKAEYVKLWSYNPLTESFYLLDAISEYPEPVRCASVFRGTETLAATIATATTVMTHDLHDLEIRRVIQDKVFLEGVKSRWMICVPVFNASNPHHLRGMFSVFTNRDVRGNEKLLGLLSHVVALWADYVGGEVCSAAAGATNYLSGNLKTGVVAFIDALHDFLKKTFDCENVTIFLRDPSRTRLEPVGKCAQSIQWRTDLPKSEHYYPKGHGLTGKVWSEREMLFSDHAPSTDGFEGKSTELPLAKREEILFAPLARLNGEVLGVVRLRNKRPVATSPASTMFTDDDAAKLDAIIQTSLPYLELLLTQRQQASSLVRLNHELQNPLLGIRGAIDLLRLKMRLNGVFDMKKAYGADYLEDIISYRDLMSRLALNTKLFGDSFNRLQPEFQRIDLALHVVEPVAKQVGPLLERYALPDGRIHIDRFQGVIPWLWVDKLMMQQVFFNLLANAIKYRDRREDFEIRIEVCAHKEDDEVVSYWIDVVDNGIGLEDDLEAPQRMFLPGVRSVTAAQFKDPAGSGIGLAVVREVVELHSGTVSFVANNGTGDENLYKKPTRIRISLPAELRNSQPSRFPVKHVP